MLKNGRPYSIENGSVDDRLITDEPEVIQDAVCEWITRYLAPRKTPMFTWSSYGIKHVLQSDTGIYLTNNQFKDAMMRCGYDPVDPDTLNWCYCLSKRSPAFDFRLRDNRPVSISRDEIYAVYKKQQDLRQSG